MNGYIRSQTCPCVRCRAHSLMGAAVLITLGVLFLMESYHVARFDRTFPVLLLVIGCMLLIQRTGSTEGHVNPGWRAGQIPAPPTPPQSSSGAAPPPPAVNPNDPEVKQ